MVTITDDVEMDVNGKKLVIVMARCHPADTATSFMAQGNNYCYGEMPKFAICPKYYIDLKKHSPQWLLQFLSTTSYRNDGVPIQ